MQAICSYISSNSISVYKSETHHHIDFKNLLQNAGFLIPEFYCGGLVCDNPEIKSL